MKRFAVTTENSIYWVDELDDGSLVFAGSTNQQHQHAGVIVLRESMQVGLRLISILSDTRYCRSSQITKVEEHDYITQA